MKNKNWQLPSLDAAKLRQNQTINHISFTLDEQYQQLGINKFYYLRTYGCQANERDSETLAGLLQAMGYQPTDDQSQADVIMLNTCAVRKNAEDKVIGELGSLKRLKRANPDLVLILCGCMAQEEGIVEFVLTTHPHVDLIFGTHNINRFPQLLYQTLMSKERVVEVYSDQADVVESLPVQRFGTHKAWVNIMYGCDKFCTYCIVPYTRGMQRSRSIEDILQEVKECQALGFKEVTLLGQNVNAYGKDLEISGGFAQLLELVAQTGIPRLRFVTSHPWDFSDAMIEVIAKYSNIMPYIHLPVQAGNNEILRRMGRRYTIEQYRALFDKLKAAIPNCTFSTDIIVGFPGETAEQFEDTMAIVDYCHFDNIYSFIYSPREHTPAALMSDDVDEATKKARLQRLNERFKSYALANNKQYLKSVQSILVDGPSKKNSKVYSGYTTTNKLVNFIPKADVKIGDIVSVRILQAKTFTLEGEQE